MNERECPVPLQSLHADLVLKSMILGSLFIYSLLYVMKEGAVRNKCNYTVPINLSNTFRQYLFHAFAIRISHNFYI